MDPHLYEPNATLLAAVVVGCLVWQLFAGITTALRWPRVSDPDPSTSELRDEPPAVVNLLTSSFKLTHEAVPATVVDLAARRALSLEQVQPDRYVCRIGRRIPDDLAPYELRTLNHLRAKAVEGVIPAGAMTTGPEDESITWWRRFEKEVIADAQERGLCKPLWTNRESLGLTIAACVPLLLFFAATGFRSLEEVESSALLNASITLGVVVGGAVVTMFGTTRQRPTERGETVARHWLGVGEHLATTETFRLTGPDAVAIWERHLAYATAMGLAGRTAEALPLGAEDPRRAWSDHGGRWRRVMITYPRRRIGWGRHPIAALAHALMVIGLSYAALRVIVSLGDVAEGLAPDMGRYVVPALWLATLAAVAALVLGVVEGYNAVIDLSSTKVVEGIVLRRRTGPADRMGHGRWYLAVDDGTSNDIRAWLLPHKLRGAAAPHDVVRVRVTPRLRYVRGIDVIGRT